MKQKNKIYLLQLLSLMFLLASAPAAFSQDVLTETGQLPGQAPDHKNWVIEATSNSYKSMAEYTDWAGSVGVDVTNNQIKDISVTGSLDYSYVYDDTVTVTEQTRYGLGDFEVTAKYKDLIKNPIQTLTPLAKWYAPTSEVSQNATLISTLAVGVTYSRKDLYFTWGTSHLLLASAFQYETTDATGSDYNAPIGASNGVNISRAFGKFSVSGSYSITTYYDYAENYKNIQTFLTSASLRITPDLNLTGYYRWRDQMISYLSAFDDDTSIAGLSLTITM